MISPNEVRFCSISNPLTCAESYWCHFGATEQTTLCCPGRGVFPFFSSFLSTHFPFFKFNLKLYANNQWHKELEMDNFLDGIIILFHNVVFNLHIEEEKEIKTTFCLEKNVNNNVVRQENTHIF